MSKMILPAGSSLYDSLVGLYPGSPILKTTTRNRKVDVPDNYKDSRIHVTGGYCNVSDLIPDTSSKNSTPKVTKPNPPKQRKILFKQKFKNGSIWKVIKDCIIEIQEEGIVWPSKDIKVYLKEGDLIKPTGKAAYHCYIPIEVQNYKKYKTVISGKVVDIEYKFRIDLYPDLENYLECIQEPPKTKSFLLEVNGEYYKNFDYYNLNHTYTSDPSKAKSYKLDFSAKSGILVATGYYNGIEDVPYWFETSSDCLLDISSIKTLKVIEYDKGNKRIISEEDILPWLNDTFKFRPLVLEYGSSIRDILKEIEGGKTFETIMILREVLNSKVLNYVSPYNVENTKTELKGILSKDRYTIKASSKSIAIGFKYQEDATQFRISYSGKLNLSLFDLNDIKKVE